MFVSVEIASITTIPNIIPIMITNTRRTMDMKNIEAQDVMQAHNELLKAHNEIMESIRDILSTISTDIAIVRENTEKLIQYRDIDKGYVHQREDESDSVISRMARGEIIDKGYFKPRVVLEKIEAELDNDVSVLQKVTGKDEKDG